MKLCLTLVFIFLFFKYNSLFCQENKVIKENICYFIKIESKENNQKNTKIKGLYLLSKQRYKGKIKNKNFFVKNKANIIYERYDEYNKNKGIIVGAKEHKWELNNQYIDDLITCYYFPDSSYFLNKQYYSGYTVLDTMMHISISSYHNYYKYIENNGFKIDSIKKKIQENLINAINSDTLYTNLVTNSRFIISGFAVENIETCECINEFMAWNKKFYITNFKKNRKLTKDDINLLLGFD